MNKAIIMSIQPKWVEKILNGEKTIEVRKTAPKFERECSKLADEVGGELGKMYREPFKVYIYCTKGNRPLVYHDADKKYIMSKWSGNSEMMLRDTLNGKVVAEFTCDRIEQYIKCFVPHRTNNNLGYENFLDDGVYQDNAVDDDGFVFETTSRKLDDMLRNKDFEKMCLTPRELHSYIDWGKAVYLWHISDLKIYDKPRELGEFHKIGVDGNAIDVGMKRPMQSWGYVQEEE